MNSRQEIRRINTLYLNNRITNNEYLDMVFPFVGSIEEARFLLSTVKGEKARKRNFRNERIFGTNYGYGSATYDSPYTIFDFDRPGPSQDGPIIEVDFKVIK